MYPCDEFPASVLYSAVSRDHSEIIQYDLALKKNSVVMLDSCTVSLQPVIHCHLKVLGNVYLNFI